MDKKEKQVIKRICFVWPIMYFCIAIVEGNYYFLQDIETLSDGLKAAIVLIFCCSIIGVLLSVYAD